MSQGLDKPLCSHVHSNRKSFQRSGVRGPYNNLLQRMRTGNVQASLHHTWQEFNHAHTVTQLPLHT